MLGLALVRILSRTGLQTSALLAALSLSGCYRVATPGPVRPTLPDKSHVMVTYVWGLIQDSDFDSVCEGKGALAEVTATTPILDALITAVTVGLVAPIHVETKCLKIGANDAAR